MYKNESKPRGLSRRISLRSVESMGKIKLKSKRRPEPDKVEKPPR